MSGQIVVEAPAETEPDRHDRILTAAEGAFAKHGFRGARMQDVASEAGMSAGNLYRYFTSKDAIVSGLVARDQAAMSEDFRRLASSDDLLGQVDALLRRHFDETPREHAQFILEIWAEAARNPIIGDLCSRVDSRVRDQLSALLASSADVHPGADVDFAARLMATLFAGLFKRRATDAAFRADTEIAMVMGVFKAALAGSLQPHEGGRA